jgi:hypothetical protein
MVAYNQMGLKNLHVQKEVKRWMKQDLISKDQYELIGTQYPSSFYHPNVLIRILLWAAGVLGLLAATGLMVLIMDSSSDTSIAAACIFGGVCAIVVLEVLISTKAHYKSGLTEALLYYAALFIIIGILMASKADDAFYPYLSFILLAIAAIRYLDLLCTAGAVLSFAYIIFNTLYNIGGGTTQQFIPFAIMIVFAALYYLVHHLKSKETITPWYDVLLVIESLSLLLAYCGGNYFIVRELSTEMMGLYLDEGQDIPFAVFFYSLTVLIPVLYLYFGIKRKDIVLIRVSLVVVAFSVFTFKYYFSLGHPEITLTLAGAILVAISLLTLNYLKVVRHGYTRENHLPEKWADMNVEAIVIAQTLGGNQIKVDDAEPRGGGDFGGGGSSDNF